MKQERLSYSYRNLALAAIKHYHDMHDILLNWRKIARFLGERKFDNDLRAYTREEIQKLLDVASVKDKAIVLLYASTGMRRIQFYRLLCGVTPKYVIRILQLDLGY